ncbi:MAG TPA: penicillin-binding transpeptidase domain-containing protein [Flavisolibacter sp.]|nr:penicillin-binding transpeptidase domain-containing protein [Flavisolibacter sp.]
MRFLLAFCLGVVLFSCSPNNVTEEESLGKYFKENKVEGTFALFDNGTGDFTVYNLGRYRDSAYLPASTFKIVNSLIGLQTGKIVNDSMVIQWDGVDRGRPECNKDLTMYDAFRVSCPPWYQELARRLGKDTMQQWLDTLAYGNKKISRIDTFWLDNSLKIRPDEQLGLVKRLYFNQLPFHKINQEIVKRAMLFEDNPNYKLSYKTGWGFRENGNSLAWMVGWIEENKHPYFFVLNVETPDKNADIPAIRMRILKSILQQLEFMQGRR